MLIKNCNQVVYFVNSDVEGFSPVLTKATGKSEYCITASTIKEKVSVGNFYAKEMYTDDFLKKVPDNVAVLLISESGGMYYPPENLKRI